MDMTTCFNNGKMWFIVVQKKTDIDNVIISPVRGTLPSESFVKAFVSYFKSAKLDFTLHLPLGLIPMKLSVCLNRFYIQR